MRRILVEAMSKSNPNEASQEVMMNQGRFHSGAVTSSGTASRLLWTPNLSMACN